MFSISSQFFWIARTQRAGNFLRRRFSNLFQGFRKEYCWQASSGTLQRAVESTLIP